MPVEQLVDGEGGLDRAARRAVGQVVRQSVGGAQRPVQRDGRGELEVGEERRVLGGEQVCAVIRVRVRDPDGVHIVEPDVALQLGKRATARIHPDAGPSAGHQGSRARVIHACVGRRGPKTVRWRGSRVIRRVSRKPEPSPLHYRVFVALGAVRAAVDRDRTALGFEIVGACLTPVSSWSPRPSGTRGSRRRPAGAPRGRVPPGPVGAGASACDVEIGHLDLAVWPARPGRRAGPDWRATRPPTAEPKTHRNPAVPRRPWPTGMYTWQGGCVTWEGAVTRCSIACMRWI